jgi:hypothetical protein
MVRFKASMEIEDFVSAGALVTEFVPEFVAVLVPHEPQLPQPVPQEAPSSAFSVIFAASVCQPSVVAIRTQHDRVVRLSALGAYRLTTTTNATNTISVTMASCIMPPITRG